MADPYTILGIARSASQGDVKSAFRKLAKKFHPDSNVGNDQAATRFSEITQANEILGDKKKRAQFDAGEIDDKGNPKNFGFSGGNPFGGGARGGGARGGANPFGNGGSFGGGGGGFRPEDIFSEIFGNHQGAASARARPTRGADVNYTIEVEFTEAALGTTRRVDLSNGRKIDMKIPADLADGQQIRLKGQGQVSATGGPAGDALVKVTVAPSSHFSRDGFNIKAELPITLYEAVLGASLRVPTLDGQVNLKIPKNTSGGKVLRLKGKGAGKDASLSQRGDLFYTVKIILPEARDENLEKLMEEWQQSNAYTSRGKDFGNNS